VLKAPNGAVVNGTVIEEVKLLIDQSLILEACAPNPEVAAKVRKTRREMMYAERAE